MPRLRPDLTSLKITCLLAGSGSGHRITLFVVLIGFRVTELGTSGQHGSDEPREVMSKSSVFEVPPAMERRVVELDNSIVICCHETDEEEARSDSEVSLL